jgi:methylthioribose-1-phosphate isomerase
MKSLAAMSIRYDNEVLEVLDQTQLPHEEIWIRIHHPNDMIAVIQRLAVRGAPLIGVAAALSLARYAEWGAADPDIMLMAKKLREARPTAVNLMHAMDHVILNHKPARLNIKDIVRRAEEIFERDVQLCDQLALRGEALIENWDGILTICNTGGLATAGVGTAFGVVRKAFENGKQIQVYACETRPLLQGARLTMWELKKLGIPATLITDSMAGALMAQGRVQKVFVGADRIAANGDFANKVGTYSLAVLAKHHEIPFYVVAPSTTMDPQCATGADIEIEKRADSEVLRDWSPEGIEVWNPAFDVTPRQLIDGIILEDRII